MARAQTGCLCHRRLTMVTPLVRHSFARRSACTSSALTWRCATGDHCRRAKALPLRPPSAPHRRTLQTKSQRIRLLCGRTLAVAAGPRRLHGLLRSQPARAGQNHHRPDGPHRQEADRGFHGQLAQQGPEPRFRGHLAQKGSEPAIASDAAPTDAHQESPRGWLAPLVASVMRSSPTTVASSLRA